MPYYVDYYIKIVIIAVPERCYTEYKRKKYILCLIYDVTAATISE